MRKFIIVLFIVNFSYGQETLILNDKASKITYNARHTLSNWQGTNSNIKGVLVYEEGISKIAIAAKIQDFNSGNSDRDMLLLDFLNPFRFPFVKFYSDDIKKSGNTILFNGIIEFHGQKKSILVYSTIEDEDDSTIISGKFRLIPSEFLIELPSFMLIKMEDFLNIQFELKF
tara:strand:- start:4549 stop:5064 length:516 start_codon:yes stop_codon:yes gene_type:complete